MVWVLVEKQGSEPYYWCLTDQKTFLRDQLPETVVSNCVWRATEQPGTGKFYYWNAVTKFTTWSQRDVLNFSGPEGSSFPVAAEKPTPDWPFTVWHRGSDVPADAGAVRPSPSEEEQQQFNDSPAGAWVELSRAGGEPGYWNHSSFATARWLPPEVEAQLKARECPSPEVGSGHPGSPLCVFAPARDPKATTWAPGAAPAAPPASRPVPWLEPGMALRVEGLEGDNRAHEGVVGTLVSLTGGKANLRLPDVLGGTILRLPPQRLAPLQKNTVVRLRGLKDPGLNGQHGHVDSHNINKDQVLRYIVRVGDRLVDIKAVKTEAVSRLWSVDLTKDFLEWKNGEQDCLFLDSSANHQRFKLQLPVNFSQRQKSCGANDPLPAWPLLVFFHGAGGGSFFHSTKKSLRTVGMQYAAEHFVTVSPVCNWKWKEKPHSWVLELIHELLAASWIDPSRVYLTGCSMGGMSTWETAAREPSLFAAIAPCAAHHHADMTEAIATSLKDMPIFAVQSSNDGTCPLSAEQVLWQRLHELGNRKLHINIGQFDHLYMFERTYCDAPCIFDWLLRFSRPRR